LSEEDVTQALAAWLRAHDWTIVAIDYPGAGSGVVLFPARTRTPRDLSGAWIPDVIATKARTCLVVECKDRFSIEDFVKLENARASGEYDASLEALLGYSPSEVLYAAGLPEVFGAAAMHAKEKVDHIYGVTSMREVVVLWPSTTREPRAARELGSST
jgi:hypothetical protein